jgi:hypothetical protein
VVAIDVDDWDAPCRRPLDLTGPPVVSSTSAAPANVGVLAVAEPNAGPGDFDPYHAPTADPAAITQELFFPVSAPHRLRSAFYLRDDPTTGKHIPFLVSVPTIQSIGAPLPLNGEGSESTPLLRPTAVLPGVATGTEDPGILFSIDVPDVHIDQDWTVAYEGALPNFDGNSAVMTTDDGYQSLTLSAPSAHFCSKGVEDWAIGVESADAIMNALQASGRAPYPESLDRRQADYIQLTEDVLPVDDPYWSQPDAQGADACWDGRAPGEARFDFCSSTFGAAINQDPIRDLPILEAYDGRVVLGRFAKAAPTATQPAPSREIINKDPSNAQTLKAVRCCFHNQVKFNVRTGSQWNAVGSVVGFLNHVIADPTSGRCVTSCDPRQALLNSRLPSLPFDASGGEFAPFRDSVLALRNPMFSLFVQNGQRSVNNVATDVVPQRDTSWHFSTRGQFTPLLVNLAASTTAVDPQSMKFITPLGQIAVVDAASQGLELIDLSTVSTPRAPFF